jgi:hypothetical protein
MIYKRLGYGLGLFSIALGAVELLAAPRIARSLDAPRRKGLVRAFGVRELVAGAGLLGAPANASGVWGRVAGDALDLAALGQAARKSPRNRTIWGSLAFVAAATALDVFVARGLDRTTGKTSPARI